jgi:hypothetical protein
MQWVTDFYATQRLWSASRVIFAGNSLDPLNSLGVPSPAIGEDVVFHCSPIKSFNTIVPLKTTACFTIKGKSIYYPV